MFQIHPSLNSPHCSGAVVTSWNQQLNNIDNAVLLMDLYPYCVQCACVLAWFASAELLVKIFFFSTTKFWFVNHDRTCVMLYVEESDHGWLVKLESFCVIVEFYVSLRVFQLVWVLPLKWLVCDDCNNGFDFMTLFIMNQNEVVQTVKLVKG